MDISHELARYVTDEFKINLANLDPKKAKEKAESMFIKIYLLPPNQLKLISKADIEMADQRKKDKLLEKIIEPLSDVSLQYYNALNSKSRKEIALLGLKRFEEAGMRALWDSRHKHKSHTGNA